jgi:hypothetical protein
VSGNGYEMLAEILTVLQRIESKLGASGVSSVEVKTSTRGYDIATKAYTGSPIEPAGDAALGEFIRVAKELEKRLMGQAA